MQKYKQKYKTSSFWYDISQNENLSMEFIDAYQNKVCWYDICQYQNLSEEIMIKHQDKLVWNNIEQYQKFSLKFYSRFREKMRNGDYLFDNRKIDKETLEKINNIFFKGYYKYKLYYYDSGEGSAYEDEGWF